MKREGLCRSAGRRGFTLVELMLVLAIISIMASIAIPGFMLITIKAKGAERDTIMSRIAMDVRDHHTRSGKLPTNLSMNPPGPINGQRHSWDVSVGNWKEMAMVPEGGLLCHYWVHVPEGQNEKFTVWTGCDLDRDGVKAYKNYRHTQSGDNWLTEGPFYSHDGATDEVTYENEY